MSDSEILPSKTVSRRRPALNAALFVAGGILVAHSVELSVPFLLVCLAVLLIADVLVLLLHRSEVLPAQCAFLLTLLMAGMLRYEAATALFPQSHISNFPHFGRSVVLAGRVVEEPTVFTGRAKVAIEIRRIEYGAGPVRACGKVLLTFGEKVAAPDYGDLITVEGYLRRPSPARNPGAFDYRTYLLRRGIFGLMSIRREGQIVALERGRGALLFERVVLPLRRSVRASVGRNLLGASRALLIGVLLGDRAGLPEEVRDAFETAGVIHVLAVSGLHVGLVAGLLLGILGFFSRSRGATVGIAIFVLLLYALLTGLRPSVLRASAMFGLLLIARALERDTDVVNILGVAALLILCFSPQSLFDVGFQLSFAATLAIVTLHRPILRVFPHSLRDQNTWWGKWIALPIGVSLAAQIGTAPIIALYFNKLALASVFANLAVVPMIGAVVSLGLLAAVFGPWLPWIATLLNATNWLLLQALIRTVRAISGIPHASIPMPAPSLLFLLPYFGVLILIVIGGRSVRARKAALFLVLIVANIYVWRGILGDRDRLEIVFLDVGQGDAIFVEFPNGRTMLVDGGPRMQSFDTGAWVLAPFLRHRGVKRLDAIVLSHPDNDHLGGLIHVAQEFEVGHLLEPGQRRDSRLLNWLLDLVPTRGIVPHRVAAGDSLIGLGGVRAVILHPTPAFVAEDGRTPYGSNNGSVVLRLEYCGVSVLLTGDVEWETDDALLRWNDRLRCTVLKAAHHGAGTSSTQPFLDGTIPEVVVISAGEHNRFGHPTPEVLERCAGTGAIVYRTDRQGAVLLTISDRGYRIRTMLSGEQEMEN